MIFMRGVGFSKASAVVSSGAVFNFCSPSFAVSRPALIAAVARAMDKITRGSAIEKLYSGGAVRVEAEQREQVCSELRRSRRVVEQRSGWCATGEFFQAVL